MTSILQCLLIGESFLDRLKTTKADYFSNERKSLEEEGLIGEILQDLEALFQQRHIHAHELAPRTIVGIHKMRGYSASALVFMFGTETLIENLIGTS